MEPESISPRRGLREAEAPAGSSNLGSDSLEVASGLSSVGRPSAGETLGRMKKESVLVRGSTRPEDNSSFARPRHPDPD